MFHFGNLLSSYIDSNRFRRMRILSVALALVVAPVLLSAQWIHTGFQFAGSVTEITSILIPQGVSGDSIMFASAYGEGIGIFVTRDGGTSWVSQDSGLGTSAVNALIDCPNGSGGYDMFAGTYGEGIYRSTNNGKEWKSANSGIDNVYVNTMLAVTTSSKTYLFAGADAPAPGHTKPPRLYVSTDLGTSWVADTAGIDTPGANVFALAYVPLSATTGIFLWERISAAYSARRILGRPGSRWTAG